MQQKDDDLVIPVLSEELHAGTVPVETGGVRVIKRVEQHEEVLQQELRRGKVDVQRVAVNHVVDGPQPVRRSGNTTIIPVVEEVTRISREWVVTEEIRITQVEEREVVEQTVPLLSEVATVQRFDESGNVTEQTLSPASNEITQTAVDEQAEQGTQAPGSVHRRILTQVPSLIKRH
jgi:stress response protein YsnF